VIFVIATMVIGPGLIVNLGLKDHWHRPRPIQTQDFNGPNPFTPWYDHDGGCQKNCSFVSGEAATGFWMVAPASVLPPPWRGPAIFAAFVFGFGASLLRLAFGGHYLSDVLLGGLITLIVIEVVRRIVWPPGGSKPESLRSPELRPSRGRTAEGRLAR
jgi:membrane-associated phospholipid phosphatase